MTLRRKITLSFILAALIPFFAGITLSLVSLSKILPPEILKDIQLLLAGRHSILLPIVVVIVVIIAVRLGKVVTNMVTNTTDTFQRLSGDHPDLSRRMPVRTKDEIAIVLNNFNLFLERMDILVGNTQNLISGLENTGETLSVNTTETAAAIVQMTSNIHSIQGQIENQENSVTGTEQAMQEISRNLEILSTSIGKQASAISESSASIEEMVASIQSETLSMNKLDSYFLELKNTAEQGNQKVEEAAERIGQVSTQSESLQEANDIISEIADQTSLLAMNAAIEAAHAGEAGKGFSVVADEIGKLAERSAEQSLQISQELNQILERITLSVEGSNAASMAFDKMMTMIEEIRTLQLELKRSVEEQDAGGKQILESINIMQNITKDVVNGSENMHMAEQAIQQEIENLNRISDEVTQSVRELNAGTKEINHAISSIQEASVENRNSIETVASVIGNYTVSSFSREPLSENLSVTEDIES